MIEIFSYTNHGPGSIALGLLDNMSTSSQLEKFALKPRQEKRIFGYGVDRYYMKVKDIALSRLQMTARKR